MIFIHGTKLHFQIYPDISHCSNSIIICVYVGSESEYERREWVKPIMFSGGLGTLDAAMVTKCPPQEGMSH